MVRRLIAMTILLTATSCTSTATGGVLETSTVLAEDINEAT